MKTGWKKIKILCILFLLAIVLTRLLILYLQDEKKWTDKYQYAHESQLFQSMLKYNLIWETQDGWGHLNVADKDFVEAEKIHLRSAGQKMTDDIEDKEQLLAILYNTPSGKFIREQVNYYNATRQLAAIRDNRLSGSIKPWRVSAAEYSSWNRLISAPFVPIDYGYINVGRLLPGFGQWQAAISDRKTITFRSVIELQSPRVVTVQIVGRPIDIKPYVSPEPRCLTGVGDCSAEKAEAFAISYNLPQGKQEITIKVGAIPLKNYRDKNLCISKKANGFNFECTPNSAHRDGLPKRNIMLLTSDGKALTDKDTGMPSQFTKENGLLSLVGYDNSSPYTLSGIFYNSSSNISVDRIFLTIDSKMQEIVNNAVQRRAAIFWPENDRYRKERRGAVLIIDADTGAILSAVPYPVPPIGISSWDTMSFTKHYYSLDPLRLFTWQVLDKHSAPGSSFKPVVALAALGDTGTNKDIIERLIKGYTISDMERLRPAGFFPDAAFHRAGTDLFFSGNEKYKSPANLSGIIPNFAGHTLREKFSFQQSRICSVTPLRPQGIFGLEEAMRSSVNIYFSRMVTLLSPTRFKETLELLGFGSKAPLNLADNIPGGVNLKRVSFKKNKEGVASGGDVLWAYTGDAESLDCADRDFKTIASYNAIGQRVKASVLEMARISGGIATGVLPQPYLIGKWGDINLPSPAGKKLGLSKERLDILRGAMKAVVESGGTAAGYFNQNEPKLCRLYAKTGTSEPYSKAPYNSAWFVGYLEPRQKDGGKNRRLAFGCFMSNAHDKNRLGSSVCAPIIADILSKLEE